jgi:hypothetical protein
MSSRKDINVVRLMPPGTTQAKAEVELVTIQTPAEDGGRGLSHSFPVLDARGWSPERVVSKVREAQLSGSTVPGVTGVVLIDRQASDELAIAMSAVDLLVLELPRNASAYDAIAAHFKSMPREGLTYHPAPSVTSGAPPSGSRGGSAKADQGDAYARDPDYANPALLRAWWQRLGAPWRPEDARDSET